MAALDTNVLVRYVVEDDAAQLAAARRLIRRCIEAGEALCVPVIVALEVEWVLRASFGYAKDDVLGALSSLFCPCGLSTSAQPR